MNFLTPQFFLPNWLRSRWLPASPEAQNGKEKPLEKWDSGLEKTAHFLGGEKLLLFRECNVANVMELNSNKKCP